MTIKEIAEIAGVSQSTVSLALNNKGAVKEDTKKLIWEIASKYGYAVSKKNSEVRRNILLIKYINSGIAFEQNGDFIARIIDAIEGASSERKYNIIIKNIAADQWEKEIISINFEEYSGMIFLATEAQDSTFKELQALQIPIVVLDNMFENVDIDAVVMDNYGGIRMAIQYLYQLGHRNIGYIDSRIKFTNTVQRLNGFKRAMDELGLRYEDHSIVEVMPTLDRAYQEMLMELQTKRSLPTAYIAGNDTMAIGAVKAFRELGIRVPEELSIIGFDDIPFCMMLDHTLTTIRVNKEILGEYAVKLLDEKINTYSDETVKIILRPKLVVRQSTGIKNPILD